MTEKKCMILVPRYYTKFSCTGSQCEDTCCAYWDIAVDEGTYRKYKKLPDVHSLKPLLTKFVKRNRTQANSSNYAKILKGEAGLCPMLTEEKLCLLQKELGEQYLCTVCATYPRMTSILDGKFEKSLSLSCPVAARLALLEKGQMEFDEIEEPIESRNIVVRELSTNDVKSKAKAYFWDLRIFTIRLLQNRVLPLSERLIVLGLFFERIQNVIHAGNVSDIPTIIGSYETLTKTSEFRESLSNISTNYLVQLKLLDELISERICVEIHPRYEEMLEQLIDGLRCRDAQGVEEVLKVYEQAFRETYQPFMAEREFIIENYLVNYVFKTLFPFDGTNSVWDSYVLLAVQFALIKMHLIGIAAFKGKLEVDDVIQVIQILAKNIEHAEYFLPHILKLFEDNGISTRAYMAILVKN